MRIASLQPSISVVLAQLGRAGTLCAITKYCLEAVPELAALNLPILHDSWSFDKPGNLEKLLELKPGLVIASVPYRIESLAAILKAGLPLLALAPRTLADIHNDMRLIARAAEASSYAEGQIAAMQSAFVDIASRARALPPVTIYCEEWGKPLIHSQGWVAELIQTANGRFIGTPGARTSPQAIAAEDPDVLLFAWCGAGDRVPLERVIEQRGWQHLRAVRNRRVFCIPDDFLNTPAFNLQDGLTAIAGAAHPNTFPPHPRVRQLRLH